MEQSPQRTLILVPPDPDLIQRALERFAPSVRPCWAYLGTDALLMERLEAALGSRCDHYSSGKRLQEIARAYRQTYIDYIGNLSEDNQGLYWWLTSISEKNPFISHLFLYFCYVMLCREITEGGERDYLIVCETESLAWAIYTGLQARGDLHLERLGWSGINSGWENLSHGIRFTLQAAWFLARFSARVIFSRFFAFSRGHRFGRLREDESILIHSWADHRSFGHPGAYSDVYLGTLGRELAQSGRHITYLVDILPSLFYPVGLSCAARSGEDIYLLEEFIHMSDLPRALFIAYRCLPCPSSPPKMAGVDLEAIINDEWERDRQDPRTAYSLLCYFAGLRLSQHLRIKSFFYTFENHIWEKMFCAAFRRTSADTLLVGYAHATVIPMETIYSVALRERAIMPLPDYFLVNGEIPRKRLIESGFDEGKVVVAGAFRYPHLWERSNHPSRHGIPRTVVVAPSPDFNETVELVGKSVRALQSVAGIHVVIKPHPTFPLQWFRRAFSALPPSFSVSLAPVEQILKEAGVLLYSSSTVSVEALAIGIHIIHVKSDVIIDINPLEDVVLIPSCSSPDEIRAAVLKALDGEQCCRAEMESIFKRFFSPPNVAVVESLLGGEVAPKWPSEVESQDSRR